MQDITTTSTLKKSRQRRRAAKFSLDDRKRFYHTWKKSGLSRNQFCREHNLTLSSFCAWVNGFEADIPSSVSTKVSPPAFVPLVMKSEMASAAQDLSQKQITLEMKLPNGFVCSFSGVLEASFMATLIQELSHGTGNPHE